MNFRRHKIMSDLIKIDVFIGVLNIIQKLANLYSKKMAGISSSHLRQKNCQILSIKTDYFNALLIDAANIFPAFA
jgi:hypothetical protein